MASFLRTAGGGGVLQALRAFSHLAGHCIQFGIIAGVYLGKGKSRCGSRRRGQLETPDLIPFLFPFLAPFRTTMGVTHISTDPPICCPLASLGRGTNTLAVWEKVCKALEAASELFAWGISGSPMCNLEKEHILLAPWTPGWWEGAQPVGRGT